MKYRILLNAVISAFLAIFIVQTSVASEWSVEQTKAPPTGRSLEDAPGSLPHALVDVAANPEMSIQRAWYGAPTRRYGHGILGDKIEGSALNVVLKSGKILTLDLPETLVFEDRVPRIVDFEGFNEARIVTIMSHVNQGAALAVFSVVDDVLELETQTPFVGRSNRWRNIAGIADFDGDGRQQIAEVVTPHIGGTLKFWTWDRGSLTLSAEMYGFSNHAIGMVEQNLSVVSDFNEDGVDDLALPADDRSKFRIMAFEGKARGKKTLKVLFEAGLPAQINQEPVLFWHGIGLTVGVADGTYWDIARK